MAPDVAGGLWGLLWRLVRDHWPTVLQAAWVAWVGYMASAWARSMVQRNYDSYRSYARSREQTTLVRIGLWLGVTLAVLTIVSGILWFVGYLLTPFVLSIGFNVPRPAPAAR